MRYVLVYSKDNCQQCKMVKRWLDNKGIKYKECNVTNDEAEAKHLRLLGFKTLPVMYVDSDKFNGFITGFDVKKMNDVFRGGK